jgi:branched-chain amino acid transport system substrate-binding protein
MNMRKIIICILTVAFLFGCNNSKKNQHVVKIGALLSLSGDIAEYGQRVKKGIDLAVEEINASNGVDGKKIEIIYEDTKGYPKDGVNGAQKLLSDKDIRLIIGPIASSVALAVEPLTTKNKVILFSPAASSPKLSGISSYFFRNWPSDVLEAAILAEYVKDTLKIDNVAILYVNNDYGIGLSNRFKQRLEELGGKILTIETYLQDAKDFRAQLAKIKSLNPSAIYLAGYHREMAYATKQIKEMGIKCQILGDADYGVQELLEITGNSSEGAIFSIPATDFNDSITSLFHQNFVKKYNTEPSTFEANGYDAVYILKKSIEVVGYNTDSITNYISKIKNYHGAAGLQTYTIDGDVIKPIAIKQVKNNQFITIQ